MFVLEGSAGSGGRSPAPATAQGGGSEGSSITPLASGLRGRLVLRVSRSGPPSPARAWVGVPGSPSPARPLRRAAAAEPHCCAGAAEAGEGAAAGSGPAARGPAPTPVAEVSRGEGLPQGAEVSVPAPRPRGLCWRRAARCAPGSVGLGGVCACGRP